MHRLPDCINRYWHDWLTRQSTYGYTLTDHEGRILSWGGDLQRLGIGTLEAGRQIDDQLLFMEGLLPLSEPTLYLPMVTIDTRHTLDIHLLRHEEGYAVLFLDAGHKKRRWADAQQAANESALRCPGDKLPDGRSAHSDPGETLENFFRAWDLAALRLDSSGNLILMGGAPDWLHAIYPELACGHSKLHPENYFTFLENFVFDARTFWARDIVGSIRSGIWIEMDATHQEHLFEATAINTGLSKMLLISNEKGPIGEKQALIQKGRDKALGHSRLEKSQSQLKTAHDKLEMRVKDRTHEIEQARQRLEEELIQRRQLERERTEMLLQLQQSQKMEAIGTLAGGIAHDFNNILSAVVGFTELSLFETEKGSKMTSNLQQVLSAALRAKELIRQILTFSRQSRPETRPVQMKGIIYEALKLLRATLPASVEIVQDIHSDGHVMADPTQLHQVVMNLCTNAGQAMLTEGGLIKVGLQNREIDQEASVEYQDILPGTYVELSVEDSGSGMSKTTLSRIFDPFFTTKEKGQGTGMGLAVVHGIVKSCKGAISVTSQIGKGTDFRVILPTVDEMDAPQIVDPATLPKGSERILFVDDEPVQAEMAMQILPPLGYRVTAMTDSSEALKSFADAPDAFDIVITDMYMPKITGKSLAMEILRLRPEMPIILCSGYSVDLVHPEFLDLYFKGHLMKPILIRELAETIRNVLDRHQGA
jgi:signal transduction histidine kinase/CheY-like chemotaxis protein